MQQKAIIYTVGVLAIVISLGTWVIDYMGLVEPCVYCRTERTVIGLLGVLILLPIVPYISRYIAFVLGFFGAYVASQQVFLTILEQSFDFSFVLAVAAVWIIIAQGMFINYLDRSQLSSRQP